MQDTICPRCCPSLFLLLAFAVEELNFLGRHACRELAEK